MTITPTLQRFLDAVQARNGTAFLVGGAVIDDIKGRHPKDIDIEIHGLFPDEVDSILSDLNIPHSEVGKSFGVILAQMDGEGIDLSFPRTEKKVGEGHTGFQVIIDPFLPAEKAARRRDFTINALMLNLHTREVLDFFGGLEDLERGTIKHIDNTTFVEDPLRVLRAMQLVARKGHNVHRSTIQLSESIKDTFQHLPKERVFEEFNKLLMKSDKPSIGLRFLMQSGWISHFPELNDLKGCTQNPVHHPEGDVWIHTLMVVDNAAKLRSEVPEDLQLAFMYGALLHDVGKPSTTDPIALTAYGHDKAAGPLARTFMKRLTNKTKLIQNVVALVEAHMRPGFLTKGNAGKAGWRRLHNIFRLDVLGHLCKADSAGRTGRSLDDHNEAFELCMKFFAEFGKTKIQPLVTGRHFIALGMQPGPQIGKLVKQAYELQIEGMDDPDEIIKTCVS